MTEPIDAHFLRIVPRLVCGTSAPSQPLPWAGSILDADRCLELFDAQLGSRHLDLAARWLQGQGKGFYTIGSSGHEGNAAVAAALRPTDPALLHYRSGAFYLERARQVPGQDPLRDVLLGVVAAAAEPISGGRHKVFGHQGLAVIPQTSTIASHLPRAVGVAFAIERARKLGVASPWPRDALAVCSFGDASANHSTALGAINAAAYCAYQGQSLPLLLLCEDNGLGISVPTPAGWIGSAHGNRAGLKYFEADGGDLTAVFDAALAAGQWVRTRRAPAFLHLRTVRLMGHAGSDVEHAYRSQREIAADYGRDPLVRTAELLIGAGLLTPNEVLARYEAKRVEVLAIAAEVAKAPKLGSAEEIMAPLAHHVAANVTAVATAPAPRDGRWRMFGGTLPESEGPLTLAQAINRALLDVLAYHPQSMVFGEDVGRKGGVYGVTRGLGKRAGRARVFDTLLDEQSILGLALGAGISGLLPIPEIQYLAYLHNAEDQLRGEAATLPFFSAGQYHNPMVLRIAGYGYQKGFGGHFHNDNSLAVLRDIPGLVVASPARPDDAAAMLRTCAAAASLDGRTSVFLEPIALYHTRDLFADGDGEWLVRYAGPREWAATDAPIGRGRTHGDGGELTLVTFANGLHMSLRVARRLERAGVGCRVLDLRWLAPLPVEDLMREAEATGRVLVVDETRRSGGVSEGVVTALVDRGFRGAISRVTSEDSFIPLGAAALRVLLSEAAIEKAAMELVGS
ncbi:thiamine pyrophosphate-dependent enzyme [Micromonospora cremea]|uniref:2-oxoisovalerate dehydrogenase E1 component n=1 Tax=Micromonospora cremea TaxID=709881 RepID=A0A1N5UF42_9ACTN|nr:thiamine pyrophosphate-dependent enzyme [Micromonospora cremea]SIM59394.1 2-oxoisovalerate dehydrogenase E1 component [Micromonospora cremea]